MLNYLKRKQLNKIMKKLLLLLFINEIAIADSTIFKNEKEGCIIPFFQKNKEPCSNSKQQTLQTIKPIVIEKKEVGTINEKRIEKKLKTILKKIKVYKKRNESEKKILESELLVLKAKFNNYKKEKNRELKSIKSKLYSTKRELKQAKNVKPKVKIVKKTKIVKKVIYKEVPIYIEKEPTPPKDIELMNVIVPDEMDIYQLALLYYGDAKKYKELYNINRDIIGSDLKVQAGQSIKIPIDLLFQSKPIALN